MKQNYEYRAIARQTLEGRWAEAVVMTIIILLVTLVCSVPSSSISSHSVLSYSLKGLSFAITVLVSLPLGYAFSNAILSLLRSDSPETNALREMWSFFARDYARSVPAYLLILVLEVALGVVTLGIGFVILSYAYAMVPYLLRDYPSLTAREALRTSREMMRGHKWELFVLQLTFIGWILLTILTAGIGYLWLQPYMEAAQAAFYEDLKAETIVDE